MMSFSSMSPLNVYFSYTKTISSGWQSSEILNWPSATMVSPALEASRPVACFSLHVAVREVEVDQGIKAVWVACIIKMLNVGHHKLGHGGRVDSKHGCSTDAGTQATEGMDYLVCEKRCRFLAPSTTPSGACCVD